MLHRCNEICLKQVFVECFIQEMDACSWIERRDYWFWCKIFPFVRKSCCNFWTFYVFCEIPTDLQLPVKGQRKELKTYFGICLKRCFWELMKLIFMAYITEFYIAQWFIDLFLRYLVVFSFGNRICKIFCPSLFHA
jgi:hypothetical protein